MTCGINVSNRWRRMTMAAMLGLCSLCAAAGPSPQNKPPQSQLEDNTRRVWNKRVREARDSDSARRHRGTAVKKGLIGVTIWRLRDDQDSPTAERVTADTLFTEGERLRLSIEVPRSGDCHLYVIDR